MDITIKTEKTYTLNGLTEYQARDLLYFFIKLDANDVPLNGRQTETINTIRQQLLNVGLTIKGPD